MGIVVTEETKRVVRFAEEIREPYGDVKTVLATHPALKSVIEEASRELTSEELEFVHAECAKLKSIFRAKIGILAHWLDLPSFWLESKWRLSSRISYKIDAIELSWFEEADRLKTEQEKRMFLVEFLGLQDLKALDDYRFDIEMDCTR